MIKILAMHYLLTALRIFILSLFKTREILQETEANVF